MKLLFIWLAILGFSVAVQLHHKEENQIRTPQTTLVKAVQPPKSTPNAAPQNDKEIAAWLQKQQQQVENADGSSNRNSKSNGDDKIKTHNTKLARNGGQGSSDQNPGGTQTKTPALPAAPTNTKIPVGQNAGYAMTSSSARSLLAVAMVSSVLVVL